jgi:hypothetical protein
MTEFKLHAGEIKPIQFFPNPQPPLPPATDPVDLTGSTVTMKWLSPLSVTKTATMVVQGDGKSAIYTSIATDFPVAGSYLFQWFISYNAGATVLESDEIQEFVGRAL